MELIIFVKPGITSLTNVHHPDFFITLVTSLYGLVFPMLPPLAYFIIRIFYTYVNLKYFLKYLFTHTLLVSGAVRQTSLQRVAHPSERFLFNRKFRRNFLLNKNRSSLSHSCSHYNSDSIILHPVRCLQSQIPHLHSFLHNFLQIHPD